MNLDISKTNISLVSTGPMEIAAVIKGINDFIDNKPALFRINYRPSYQRGEAWDFDFKEKLILSVLVNFPIGNIILRTLVHNPSSFMEVTHEIVDGQQRLLAIRDYMLGKYKLGITISKSILEQKKELFEYDINVGIKNSASKVYKKYIDNKDANFKLGFSDLPTALQTQINTYRLSVIVVESSDEAISQYFRFIQNQERLRAGEIINSIPDSFLLQYLMMINNRDAFLSKINWHESRKEFEKIFYSMIGIFDNKLNFGTTDVAIIEYVGNIESVSDYGQEATMRMVGAINNVTNCNIINEGKFSKRLIKFFLLSAGFDVINYDADTDEKFKTLLTIEAKMPHFNSGKKEDVEKVFSGYPQEVVDTYQELFILGRGSHSPRSTRITISKLKKLFEYEMRKSALPD